jgi:hypothetical protein
MSRARKSISANDLRELCKFTTYLQAIHHGATPEDAYRDEYGEVVFDDPEAVAEIKALQAKGLVP